MIRGGLLACRSVAPRPRATVGRQLLRPGRQVGGPRRAFSAAEGQHHLPTELRVKIFRGLSEAEKADLTKALAGAVRQASRAAAEATSEGASTRPTFVQLRRYFLQGMLPMVGFGFVDNAIMLTAGDAIDSRLGATLHISTLAAAGLGNLVSDVLGLGLSSYVEALATKVGIPSPGMSVKQMAMPVARWTMLAASVVGISIGCLLGMVPLCFIQTDVTTADHVFRALDVDATGRCSLTEMQPFLLHLGLDARRPEQLASVLDLDPAAVRQGLTREQFSDLWATMEGRQHDRLKTLADEIVARRRAMDAAKAAPPAAGVAAPSS